MTGRPHRPLLADPPAREDGGCAVCGRVRPPVAVKHDDPFCTTACAAVFHTVVFETDEEEAEEVSPAS